VNRKKTGDRRKGGELETKGSKGEEEMETEEEG
jgi:hypothetical protein